MGYNIHLRFPENISTEPIVCNLTRKFDLDFNISKAQISSGREGYLILELLCSREQANQAKKYLEEQGIHVSDLAQSIIRDEKYALNAEPARQFAPPPLYIWIKTAIWRLMWTNASSAHAV